MSGTSNTDSVSSPLLGYGGGEEDTVQQAIDLSNQRYPVPSTTTGANLLKNGSFEVAGNWHMGGGWTMPFASATAYDGLAVARLVAAGGTTPGVLASEFVTIADVNDSYVVSFLARLPAYTRGSARALLRAFDAAGVRLWEYVLLEVTEESFSAGEVTLGEWFGTSVQFQMHQDEEIDQVLPEETATIRLVFDALNADLTFDVDAVQFARGEMEQTFAPRPGEVIDGNAILPGSVPASAFDLVPPAVPTGLTLTTDSVLGSDGTSISRIYATLIHPTDDDYVGSEIEIVGDFTQADPLDPNTRSPVWPFAHALTLAKDASSVTYEPAIGGNPYWARARSVDATGNRSAWSPITTLAAAADGDAPPIPTITQAVPGFRLVGVWWSPVAASDLSHYEVRWRAAPQISVSDAGTVVVANEWTSARTRATSYVATDLETTDAGPDPVNPDTEAYHRYTYYAFQVRAVDLSGNVRTGRSARVLLTADAATGATTLAAVDVRSLLAGGLISDFAADATTYIVTDVTLSGDGVSGTFTIEPPLAADRLLGDIGTMVFDSPVPVIAADNPYAGWGPPFDSHPTLAGTADIAANSIVAAMIRSGEIQTGHLQAGIINTTDLIADGVITGPKIQAGAITADHIAATGLDADELRGGTLTLGGPLPSGDDRTNPALLTMLDDAGRTIGIFDNNGVVLLDATDPRRQVRWRNGALQFTDEGNPDDTADPSVPWGTSIDGRGVIADSILVGTAPGGHNAIPNPSFERSPFLGAPDTNTWTTGGSTADTTHWGGAAPQASTGGTLLSGSINIDTSGADLKLLDVTY